MDVTALIPAPPQHHDAKTGGGDSTNSRRIVFYIIIVIIVLIIVGSLIYMYTRAPAAAVASSECVSSACLPPLPSGSGTAAGNAGHSAGPSGNRGAMYFEEMSQYAPPEHMPMRPMSMPIAVTVATGLGSPFATHMPHTAEPLSISAIDDDATPDRPELPSPGGDGSARRDTVSVADNQDKHKSPLAFGATPMKDTYVGSISTDTATPTVLSAPAVDYSDTVVVLPSTAETEPASAEEDETILMMTIEDDAISIAE